jgi:hypothetical protein
MPFLIFSASGLPDSFTSSNIDLCPSLGFAVTLAVLLAALACASGEAASSEVVLFVITFSCCSRKSPYRFEV